MSTFGAQRELKQLPVPELAGTLEAYLASVECLLTPEQFAETKRLAADFAAGQGVELQALLEERAKAVQPWAAPKGPREAAHPDGSAYPDCSWLERWWETYAYQGDRTSLAVNINCFQSHFKATQSSQPLLRCAWALKGCLDAKRQLAAGTVPPERAGKSVFCSAQYHRVFSTTRIPSAEVDKLTTFTESRHICVERRGHWYKVDNAEDLSVEQLEAQLAHIKADAGARAPGPGIAAFTGAERSFWAAARDKLLQAAPSNAAALRDIESAIFHLVLSEDCPATRDDVQRLGQHGNGQQIWFDKSQTHILFDNGALITNLEHSSADAVVPARIYVYMDEFVQQNAPEGTGMPVSHKAGFKMGVSGIPVTRDVEYATPAAAAPTSPARIDLVLNAAVEADLAEARRFVGELIEDNIVTCLEFPDFGAKTVARDCKGLSTDSFMQMSLALAYFRDQNGEMPVPYETASTRSFLHGRTETIRPQSMAMKAFLEAFDCPGTPQAALADQIRAAANHHRNYLRRCMAGKGVDRHLMGLRLLAAEKGLPMHPLFTDQAYTRSTRFTLSTSQMPWAVEDWPGFGAYDPVAYACCYRFTHDDTIVATVASRGARSGNGKDAKRFCEVIKTAMRDIYSVLAANPPAPTAKL